MFQFHITSLSGRQSVSRSVSQWLVSQTGEPKAHRPLQSQNLQSEYVCIRDPLNHVIQCRDPDPAYV